MKKHYTITSTGRVQLVGFRGYAEDLCRQLVVGAVIYNAGEDQVKIACEAEEAEVDRLCKLLKEYKLAEIAEIKIEEGIQLPYPAAIVVTALEQELLTRIDAGVRILEDMNESISSIKHDTEALHDMKIILEKIERKL